MDSRKREKRRKASKLRIFKKVLVATAIMVAAVVVSFVFSLRAGLRQLQLTPYPVPAAAFTNWYEVLSHPRDISVVTLRTGTIHMDACLNLDPASPKQTECDHSPRDLAVLVHWVHHPRLGDILIDTGFDDSYTQHPPY